MDNQITPVHLVQPLYKHLMGWPMTLRDLEHIDEDIFRNLVRLLDIEDIRFFNFHHLMRLSPSISVLDLDFSTTEDRMGVAETVDLVPNGSKITVTQDKLEEYLIVQLKVHFDGSS